jgi:hypothetical protein
MTTYADLVNRVRQQIMGYAKDQVAVSELAQPMTAADTSFTVATATIGNISQGLVEIEDELVLVTNYDPTSGTVQVMGGANGRGAEGTTAAAHDELSLVVSGPRFPRARIKEEIDSAILGTYPSLVSFGYTTISNVSVVYEYGMPADAMDVWAVADQTVGPSQVWMQGVNARFNPTADPTAFPTGKSIQLWDPVTPGRSMRVKYTKAPGVLANADDDFADTTGLPDRCADLIVWGACSRLLPAYEAARLQQQAVEATERAPLVPPKSAVSVAAYYYQMYQQRLEEERMRQFADHPQTTFYVS